MTHQRARISGRSARFSAFAGAAVLVLVAGAATSGTAQAATVTPAITTSCPSPLPTLSYGMMNNTCVAYLQGSLNGAYGFHLSVDGNFGPDTLAAVKAFQTKAGIGVDGQVGPQTWGALTLHSVIIDNGECMAALDLTPNYNNGGASDWGAAAYLESGNASVTCEGFLMRDESGWSQVSDTHAVAHSSVTTYTYWDGVGAKAKACIAVMQSDGLMGPLTCTNPF